MSSSFKAVFWVPIAAALFAACGGSESDPAPVASTNGAPTDGASSQQAPDPQATPATALEREQKLGEKLADATYHDMIDLGNMGGWDVYYDKDNALVVATNGESSVNFNPNELDEATVRSLSASGVPEELLWSWKGVVCRAACWTAGAMLCASVADACIGATVLTVGGFALPCGVAVIAACGAGGGGASVCSDWCTDRYG